MAERSIKLWQNPKDDNYRARYKEGDKWKVKYIPTTIRDEEQARLWVEAFLQTQPEVPIVEKPSRRAA